MELEGLKRGISELEANKIPIASNVTDRHMGVRKWLQEKRSQILHWFDIWHVAVPVQREFRFRRQ